MPDPNLYGQVWLFASNAANFDVEDAFSANEVILWSETTNAHVRLGETVFLYATKPTQVLTHQCVVSGTGLPEDKAHDAADHWVDDDAYQDRRHRTWMELRLVRTLNSAERQALSLSAMTAAGLQGGVQGRRRAPEAVLSLLREVLLSSPTLEESDHSAEDLPSDDLLVEDFAARMDDNQFAISEFEAHVPDQYAYRKTRGSAQKVFADRVKDNYGYKCAITGITTRYFLVASHIVPWSEDASIRLDPSNGICLSTLVDRAFEDGYLRIDREGVVHIDGYRLAGDPVLANELVQYDGRTMTAPATSPPNPNFLERRWTSTLE